MVINMNDSDHAITDRRCNFGWSVDRCDYLVGLPVVRLGKSVDWRLVGWLDRWMAGRVVVVQRTAAAAAERRGSRPGTAPSDRGARAEVVPKVGFRIAVWMVDSTQDHWCV